MTDTKLRELLVVIDDHYGRARSLEERRADTQIYIRAFGTIPDEIVEKALYTAFTQCRFQNQLIVDWCSEIKKLLSAQQPSANDLWAQAAAAARKIEANLYYPRRIHCPRWAQAERRRFQKGKRENLRRPPDGGAAVGWLPGRPVGDFQQPQQRGSAPVRPTGLRPGCAGCPG